MSRYFLKKTWGFDPSKYPMVGFRTAKAMNTLLNECGDDDWVLIAGTMGEDTPEHQRGRLLGMVKIGKSGFDAAKALDELNTPITKRELDQNGFYKWPNALAFIEAYSFDGSPDLADLFGDHLVGQVWANSARNVDNISSDASSIIDALKKTQVPVAQIPEVAKAKERLELINRGQCGGATPTGRRKGSETELVDGFAYLLKLNGSRSKEVYKVGYSANPDRRLKEHNKGLLTSITGFEWEEVRRQYFDEWDCAYAFEQLLHKELEPHRVKGEVEIYQMGMKYLDSAWTSMLISKNWEDPDVRSKYRREKDGAEL